jgi:methyltransferase
LGRVRGVPRVFALQRVGELVLSRRNLERLRARGARERGARQFPWFVALHTAFPMLIALEIRAGPPPVQGGRCGWWYGWWRRR